MSDIRIGIIGAGYIASKHLEVIDQIKGLKVIGITSRTLSKAKKMAKKYNINNVRNSLVKLQKTAYKKFYFRPKIILNELLRIRSFHEFKTKLSGAIKVLELKNMLNERHRHNNNFQYN